MIAAPKEGLLWAGACLLYQSTLMVTGAVQLVDGCPPAFKCRGVGTSLSHSLYFVAVTMSTVGCVRSVPVQICQLACTNMTAGHMHEQDGTAALSLLPDARCWFTVLACMRPPGSFLSFGKSTHNSCWAGMVT